MRAPPTGPHNAPGALLGSDPVRSGSNSGTYGEARPALSGPPQETETEGRDTDLDAPFFPCRSWKQNFRRSLPALRKSQAIAPKFSVSRTRLQCKFFGRSTGHRSQERITETSLAYDGRQGMRCSMRDFRWLRGRATPFAELGSGGHKITLSLAGTRHRLDLLLSACLLVLGPRGRIPPGSLTG